MQKHHVKTFVKTVLTLSQNVIFLIVGTVNPQFPEYNLFSGAGSVNRRFIMAYRTIWNFQIVAGDG